MNWINCRLPYLYKKQIYPSWDIRNANHGDPKDLNRIIPEIIVPNHERNSTDNPIDLLDIERFDYEDFNHAHFYFKHFFKFNEEIISLSKEISKDFKNCLGLHLRGHDKALKKDKENIPISNEDYILKVKTLANTKSFDSVFILSDDPNLKIFLSETISSIFNVPIFQSPFKPMHHIDQKNRADKLDLTKESVAEMLALSECSLSIKNQSAFSSWAKIINPSIEMYRVSKCKQTWFPDYYLPEL
jgi:hypothetical protein